MNDTMTNDLMIHVERIVRPIPASQRRKLRMRKELLAHLQAALEEEQGRATDQSAALECAKQRLGEPSELTSELRRSVPRIERVLNSPGPVKLNRLEYRLISRLRMSHSMVFAYSLILFAAGAIAVFVIWMFSPHISASTRTAFFVNEIDHPGHAKTVLISAWVLQMAWLYAGWRFLFTAAAPLGKFRWSKVATTAFLTLLMQASLMYLIMTQIVGRSPTIAEMTQSLTAGVILLFLCTVVARAVAILRQPYDEWLTLDLK